MIVQLTNEQSIKIRTLISAYVAVRDVGAPPLDVFYSLITDLLAGNPWPEWIENAAESGATPWELKTFTLSEWERLQKEGPSTTEPESTAEQRQDL